MPDNSVTIAELEAILNAGQSEISVDGLRTKIDLGEIRRRLTELRATDADNIAAKMVRPTVARIKLGNAW